MEDKVKIILRNKNLDETQNRKQKFKALLPMCSQGFNHEI